jgi:hypothetical protein
LSAQDVKPHGILSNVIIAILVPIKYIALIYGAVAARLEEGQYVGDVELAIHLLIAAAAHKY